MAFTTKPKGGKLPAPANSKAPRKRVETSTTTNVRPRQPKLRPGPKPREKLRDKRDRELNVTHKSLSQQARDRITVETIEAAKATGLMPHEWLLAVMRGEQMNHFAYDAETAEIIEIVVLPTFADRMEAAKASAPYYATRLSVKGPDPKLDLANQGVMEVPLAESMEAWTDVAQQSQSNLKAEVTK